MNRRLIDIIVEITETVYMYNVFSLILVLLEVK